MIGKHGARRHGAEGITVLPSFREGYSVFLVGREGRTGSTKEFPDLFFVHPLVDLLELLQVLIRTGQQGQASQQEQYSTWTGQEGHAVRGS